MNVTESEKLLVIQKKEEIGIVSQEILDLICKEVPSPQDIIEIKKKLLHILSLLHLIAVYATPNIDLNRLRSVILDNFDLIENKKMKTFQVHIQAICFFINSIDFSYGGWYSFWSFVWPSRFMATIPQFKIEYEKK